MRQRFIFKSLALSIFFVILSCTTDDYYPNPEADIESATIENAVQLLQTNPRITNDEVTFTLKDTVSNFLFSPEFGLSQGTTIEPKSGSELNFCEPQEYVVTSEDGEWTKTYTVRFIVDSNSDGNYYLVNKFSFEEVVSDKKDNYHIFIDPKNPNKRDWSSGNEGFAITLPSDKDPVPKDYPTVQTENGYEENGVKLETKETGKLGGMVGTPLAAGNLFLGDFVISFPTTNATHFGRSYNLSDPPKALRGYFKYKAGKEFKVNNEEKNKISKDAWDAYAILFKKRPEENYLLGDHGFKDKRIVAVARLDKKDRIETDEWSEFNIPFEFKPGKVFRQDQDYMITIVFSSSVEGDIFNGAVGSTLLIDEVKLVTE